MHEYAGVRVRGDNGTIDNNICRMETYLKMMLVKRSYQLIVQKYTQ